MFTSENMLLLESLKSVCLCIQETDLAFEGLLRTLQAMCFLCIYAEAEFDF